MNYVVKEAFGKWRHTNAKTTATAKRAAARMAIFERTHISVGIVRADGSVLVLAVRQDWSLRTKPGCWHDIVEVEG